MSARSSVPILAAAFAAMCTFSSPGQAPPPCNLIDVWDSTDPQNFVLLGQIATIKSEESGAQHYDYYSASGHPAGVDVAALKSNLWIHERTASGVPTGDYTFGFLFNQDNAPPASINTATLNFRIVGSSTPTAVTLSDDLGEAHETPPGSAAYLGSYTYGANTDGLTVGGLSGGAWTVIIDAVEFGDITSWFAANGATTSFGDDVALTLGHEYRLTPCGNPPSGLPACAMLDVWDTTDPQSPVLVGQVAPIQTEETGAEHYAYSSASGHPSGVNVAAFASNLWVHERLASGVATGDFSFGFIFNVDDAADLINNASLNFRIVGSSTPTFVSLADEPRESVESPPGSAAYVGTYRYTGNTDGITVGGLSGGGWTIIIDSVNFGNVTDWRAANGLDASFTDDLNLVIGHEYRITPCGNPPALDPVIAINDPPVVVIVNPTDGLITSSTSVFVDATVADLDANAVVSDPAGVAPESVPAGGGSVAGLVPLLLEGPNVISVSSTDTAAQTASTSVVVVRDSAAPNIAVSPAEGMIVSSPIPGFSISVNDYTATVVSINGAPAGATAAGDDHGYGLGTVDLIGSISLWQEGPNSITIEAVDAAGNATVVVRTVFLDSTAPAITITSPVNGACYTNPSETTIGVVVTIDDASAVVVSGSVSGSIGAGGGTLAGTVTLVEGANTISVTVQDAANNTSATETITVMRDTTAPVVVVTSPADGACVRGAVDFGADVSDVLPGSVATRAFLVDGVALPESDLHQVDTTTLADGPHTLTVVAADGCGNAASTSIAIFVDNTAPTVVITDPTSLAYVNGTISFGASADDAGSGIVAVTMTAAGSAPTVDGSFALESAAASATATSSVDTAAASGGLDGDMQLAVTARDCAGNESVAYVTVRVDNTAPGKAITSPAAGSVVGGLVPVTATVTDPNLASVQFIIDGVASPPMTSGPFQVSWDTLARLDGDVSITLVATDLAGNISTCTIVVSVNNLSIKVHPETLQLKSKGGPTSITAKVTGPNTAQLASTDPQTVLLCVPGGSPIPMTWMELATDGATMKFDRQLLIGSLRGAGLTSGTVTLTIKVVRGAQSFPIGSDTIRVQG